MSRGRGRNRTRDRRPTDRTASAICRRCRTGHCVQCIGRPDMPLTYGWDCLCSCMSAVEQRQHREIRETLGAAASRQRRRTKGPSAPSGRRLIRTVTWNDSTVPWKELINWRIKDRWCVAQDRSGVTYYVADDEQPVRDRRERQRPSGPPVLTHQEFEVSLG